MADIFSLSPIILDLKKDTYKEIEVHQFDDATLVFNLVNYSIPVDLTDYSVEFRCAKPSNPETYAIQTNNITKNSSGKVTVAISKDVVNVSGNVNCELRLVGSDTSQISTFNITLIVKKSVLDGVNEGEPFVIDLLGELNDTIDNAREEDVNLKSTISSAQSIDTTLKETTSLAGIKNTTLQGSISIANTTISNINTAITSVNASKTDINNTMNTATTFKGTFSSDINTITTQANTAKTDLSNVYAQAKTVETSILYQNGLAVTNISTLNTFKATMPNYLELLHTNYNMIEMLWFMERNISTRATRVNNNLYVDSFIDDSKLTLDTITYDSTNKQVLIGDGYVQSIGYWYE